MNSYKTQATLVTCDHLLLSYLPLLCKNLSVNPLSFYFDSAEELSLISELTLDELQDTNSVFFIAPPE